LVLILILKDFTDFLLAGHVARKGGVRNAYNISIEKSEVKGPLERLGIDGKIILGWILGR
jgi:hypothetical protein